jgi:3-methyladenine DNA glycosylase/8-oxoguanine DNA glycosylase
VSERTSALVFDRMLRAPVGFSLAATCGAVAWAKGRWPSVDWIDGVLIWVRRERGEIALRWVRQREDGCLWIGGDRDPRGDEAWCAAVLGTEQVPPALDDPIVAALAATHPGMRSYSSGSLFDGIVGCIAGQSITVMAAAVTETRIAALFDPGVPIAGRSFLPPPSAESLAAAEPALIRTAGVTWRRAEAIVAAAKAQLAGELPDDGEALADPERARAMLLALPLVGPWTAESALLWGLGMGDAFPPNDAALLRAARLAYGVPGLDHKGLNRLAEGWRPGRAWAARWLWTGLLGVAPDG